MHEEAGDRSVVVFAVVCDHDQLGEVIHGALDNNGLVGGSMLVRAERALADPLLVAALASLFTLDGVRSLRRQLREGDEGAELPESPLDRVVST